MSELTAPVAMRSPSIAQGPVGVRGVVVSGGRLSLLRRRLAILGGLLLVGLLAGDVRAGHQPGLPLLHGSLGLVDTWELMAGPVISGLEIDVASGVDLAVMDLADGWLDSEESGSSGDRKGELPQADPASPETGGDDFGTSSTGQSNSTSSGASALAAVRGVIEGIQTASGWAVLEWAPCRATASPLGLLDPPKWLI